LSDALAVTVIDPLTVDPAAGDVIATDGGVVSDVVLDTVTVTPADVVRLPAASRATALSVCEPLLAVVVFHATAYGALGSSPPSAAPSSVNCTPTTPTLSDALAVTVIDPLTVDPAAGDVIATDGGVVSGTGLDTVTLTGSDVYRRPTRSRATAVRVWEPLLVVVVFQETEYGAERSSAPRLTPSSWNWTPTTVRLPTTETMAVTEVVPETVDPEDGEVIVTRRLPTPGSGGSGSPSWAQA
jgi:hypothetical protein